MAEQINQTTPFSSAGHRWHWGDQEIRAKEYGAVGVDGVGYSLLQNGARPGVVAGVLKASGATRAIADAALDALETAIKTLCRSGLAYGWEDDCGHTGDSLVIKSYEQQGPREYGRMGAETVALQTYVVRVRELDGKP